jgi:hypothetical protein
MQITVSYRLMSIKDMVMFEDLAETIGKCQRPLSRTVAWCE